MNDKTNRCVKICRRLKEVEVELILSLKEGRTQIELDELRNEMRRLETELDMLETAT